MTRFGHHLLQCRKALSKQPTSPYYHKIDDLAVSTNCKTDLSFIYFSIKLKYELKFSRIYLNSTSPTRFGHHLLQCRKALSIRLITTRLMIWWSVLEFGLEIFISMYTRESHQTYKETPINFFGHKNVKQKPLHLPERIECIYFSDGVEPNEKITSILHFVFFRFADSTLSITFQEEEWRNISKNVKEVSPCSRRSHLFPKSVLLMTGLVTSWQVLCSRSWTKSFCSCFLKFIYRKVASSNTSCLKHMQAFSDCLHMKGIFDLYVLWPFDKKLIS